MTGLAFNPCVYCTHKNCNLCELEMFRKNQINIAKEIFAEIAKSVVLKIPPHISLISKNDLGFEDGLIEGKTDALREVLFIVDELKKKYTEVTK